MQLDKLALICITVPVAIWIIAIVASALTMFPYGLLILIVLLIIGYFFYRVIKERIQNKEDDYYEKNIEQ